MPTFIELLKDHALIPVAANALCAVIASPEPQPRQAHDALRRFARLLDAHLRAEEQFLTQVRDDDDPEFTTLAIAHGEAFQQLAMQCRAYVARWDEAAINGDWAAFGDATTVMMARISAQISAEDQSLYAAARRYGLAPP